MTITTSSIAKAIHVPQLRISAIVSREPPTWVSLSATLGSVRAAAIIRGVFMMRSAFRARSPVTPLSGGTPPDISLRSSSASMCLSEDMGTASTNGPGRLFSHRIYRDGARLSLPAVAGTRQRPILAPELTNQK